MLLQVKDLCLSFGGLKATDHVNMDIAANEITALIGPNGAGKTTMFNQIAGVYKPDSGEIWFDGKRIDGKKPYQICQAGIARTYQSINLFRKMTVLDNVLVGMHCRLKSNVFSNFIHTPKMKEEETHAREKAYELMEFVGISEYAKEQAGSLPYGKQRLLEIIRGMGSDPKLILLDEPAAGMNSAEKEDLNQLIREIVKRNITVLIVEHDMKLIMNIAHKIYVIESGKNLACGTADEVSNNPDVIAAYLGGDD